MAGISFLTRTAQQSVHLTLGILRKSQAVFYALAFFWLDGEAVPAPAQSLCPERVYPLTGTMAQSVGPLRVKQ
jgi:hypothetical protein